MPKGRSKAEVVLSLEEQQRWPEPPSTPAMFASWVLI
jgi:hypothetical protein